MNEYNTHIHTFMDIDTPNGLLGPGVVPILRTKVGYSLFSGVTHRIVPFSDRDLFDRYRLFAKTGRMNSQYDIFMNCAINYNPGTIFIVLSMDMSQMGAGRVPRPYVDQVNELLLTARRVNEEGMYQIRPFIHIDPRSGITIKQFERWHNAGMAGLKIYPSLGYFPYDVELDPFYSFCEAHNMSVITHCSPANPIHSKSTKSDIYQMLDESKDFIDLRGKTKKQLCSEFTKPTNWIYVREKHPNLPIILSHIGSMSEVDKYIADPTQPSWTKDILDMAELYDNIYFDDSFTSSESIYNDWLYFELKKRPKLQSKALSGSDYYMNQTETTEAVYLHDKRKQLKEMYVKMAFENPKRLFH